MSGMVNMENPRGTGTSRRDRWKYASLALAALMAVLTQLANLNDDGRRFVRELDEGVYRAAGRLNPMAFFKRYNDYMLGTAATTDPTGGEGGGDSCGAHALRASGVSGGEIPKGRGARDATWEDIRKAAEASKPEDRVPRPLRYLQIGRHMAALTYALRAAFEEGPFTLALTLVALLLAGLAVKDLLRALNDGRAVSDYACFWGVLLLGPLAASLLMFVLQGLMALAHAAFGQLLAASSIPLLVFGVELARDWAKARAEHRG